jgi:GNAT superfamily N-acetyltransferase
MPPAETIYYLEMKSRDDLRPAAEPVEVRLQESHDPDFSRSLYATVGGNYNWIERGGWTDRQWLDQLTRPNVETWYAYDSGELAGFFELEMQESNSVEIVYFGLLPEYVGKGLGGAMLSEAVLRAWDMGASRVWLHTSSLDHAHALPNYQARGFHIYNKVDVPAS